MDDCTSLVTLARRVLADDFGAADAEAIRALSEGDRRTVIALAAYELRGREEAERKRRQRTAQRRALRLLRSLLSPAQRAELARGREFRAVGSAGGVYRLCPLTGVVYRIEQHGRRWYGVASYCIHETDNSLPPADTSVAQLLLLSSDEPAFLATANATERRPMSWDGEWRARLRTARAARMANAGG